MSRPTQRPASNSEARKRAEEKRAQGAGDTCLDCQAGLIVGYRWLQLPLAERARLRAEGFNKKGSLGYCDPCRHNRARRAARLASTRPLRKNEHVLEDWAFLVDRSLSLGANIRLIAPRIGMTPNALEKALARAGVRAWPTDKSA